MSASSFRSKSSLSGLQSQILKRKQETTTTTLPQFTFASHKPAPDHSGTSLRSSHNDDDDRENDAVHHRNKSNSAKRRRQNSSSQNQVFALVDDKEKRRGFEMVEVDSVADSTDGWYQTSQNGHGEGQEQSQEKNVLKRHGSGGPMKSLNMHRNHPMLDVSNVKLDNKINTRGGRHYNEDTGEGGKVRSTNKPAFPKPKPSQLDPKGPKYLPSLLPIGVSKSLPSYHTPRPPAQIKPQPTAVVSKSAELKISPTETDSVSSPRASYRRFHRLQQANALSSASSNSHGATDHKLENRENFLHRMTNEKFVIPPRPSVEKHDSENRNKNLVSQQQHNQITTEKVTRPGHSEFDFRSNFIQQGPKRGSAPPRRFSKAQTSSNNEVKNNDNYEDNGVVLPLQSNNQRRSVTKDSENPNVKRVGEPIRPLTAKARLVSSAMKYPPSSRPLYNTDTENDTDVVTSDNDYDSDYNIRGAKRGMGRYSRASIVSRGSTLSRISSAPAQDRNYESIDERGDSVTLSECSDPDERVLNLSDLSDDGQEEMKVKPVPKPRKIAYSTSSRLSEEEKAKRDQVLLDLAPDQSSLSNIFADDVAYRDHICVCRVCAEMLEMPGLLKSMLITSQISHNYLRICDIYKFLLLSLYMIVCI